MTDQGIKLVFGGGSFGIYTKDAATTTQWLDALKAGGCRIVDSAQMYTGSEALLGEAGAGKRGFIVDTKDPAGALGKLDASAIEGKLRESLKQLNMGQVDIFYFHAPDQSATPEEFLPILDKLHKEGLFERFGVSNFEASHVEQIWNYADKNNLVKPSVYQGNYNAFARKQEQVLFPTLRKLGMAFYAYSPLAGGFLSKSKEDFEAGAGRFNDNVPMIGPMYKFLYGRPTMLESLADWEKIAKEEGCSRAALGFRWVRYNSALDPEHGDALIFGASSVQQIEETLRDINSGPLKPDTVKKIDQLWDKVSHEAPLDNFEWFKAGSK